MNAVHRATVCSIACCIVALAACSRDKPSEPPAAVPATTQAAAPVEQPADAAPEDAAGPGSIAGTSWRLVQIVSMDDTTYTPDDPALYTLEFGTDGSMRVRADCNSGTGSYTSESASQLKFGVIAATQAECAPGSLHDRYMAEFQWVRSYTMKDRHLFLATMADGSIIEFEPAAPTSQ
jgi:heat shock protein HslJ